MILAVFASLTSYCQYPAIKRIGIDTVVLITTKQGEKINKVYTVYKDSVTVLDNKNKVLNTNLISYIEKNKLSEEVLRKKEDSLAIMRKNFTAYQNKYNQLHIEDIKARNEVKIGIGIAVLTWLALTFTIKN